MLAALNRQKHVDVLRARLTLPNALETLLDPLMASLCLYVTTMLCGESFSARYVLLTLIAFSLTYPGNLQLHDTLRRTARKTIINWLMAAGILLIFGYASGYERFFPDKVIYGWILVTPCALVAVNALVRSLLPKYLENGNQTTAIIVGGNDTGMSLASQFNSNRFLGMRFVGFFDDRSRDRLAAIGDLPFLGTLCNLASFVKQHRIAHIYLALPMASQPRILQVLDELKDTTASIFFVPDLFVTDLIQGRMETIAGVPVVAVCETPFTGVNGAVKRVFDLVLALLILLLISPLLVLIALGVKLSSPGPIIFKQRRYGLDGKEIVIYKFRSMTVCEDGTLVRQATRNDRRVTTFGALLRRTSCDELPQFINVLQGRMSIVGPRPHAVSHNEEYRKLIKGYMVRHKVKPGITGWAQVNGCRGETKTVEKMEQRIAYDLEYLRGWSLNLDLWIIFKTMLVIARDEKAY